MLTNKKDEITEALSSIKAKVGEVKFSETKLDDPHIKKVIQYLVASGKITEQELKKRIDEKIVKFADVAQKAPILYSTIMKNIVEDIVFGFFKGMDVEGAPKFSKIIFNKLWMFVSVENKGMWPLNNFIDRKSLHNPQRFFIDQDAPDFDKKSKYSSVDTAAATPNGHFIFNVQFMQNLLNWAHIKGLKPKSKKYKSNGGQIPDEYAYIEFLIMHELMHYTCADFYYQKIIPNANSKIINWVGDFRSNYDLVKSGYEQLPMGLYNDHINYDRQTSYSEMYNLVKSEFDKLPKEEQEKVSGQMGEQSDDHGPGNEEGETGEGETGDKTTDDIDKGSKGASQKVAGEDAEGEPEKQGDTPSNKLNDDSEKPGSQIGSNKDIEWKNIRPPVHDWKSILRQLLSSSSNQTEETYSKPSRRMVSGLDVLVTRGATAVKPGDLPTTLNNVKLLIIADTSGSMYGDIAEVLKFMHTLCLLPELKTSIIELGFFSVQHSIYGVNFASKKGWLMNDDNSQDPSKRYKQTVSHTVDEILTAHKVGGTEISSKLDAYVKARLQEGFNVILFSDTDVTVGQNASHIRNWIKSHTKQTFLIGTDLNVYESYVRTFGVNSRFSCIKRKS